MKFTILGGTNSSYGDKSGHPQEFKDIFEAHNLVLVSGIQQGHSLV